MSALRLLREAGVPHVLLSGFLGERGGDVDLHVPHRDRDRFAAFCERHGVLEQCAPPRFANHFFYHLRPPGLRPVRLHVKYELSFRDSRARRFRLASFGDEVMGRLRSDGPGPIPEPWHLLLLYAAKCAWPERRALDPGQLRKLARYVDLSLPHLERGSEQASVAERLRDALSSRDTTTESVSRRVAAIVEPWFPFGSPRVLQRDRPTRARRFGRPACTVLVIGADGTGKSTLVEALARRLELPVRTMYGGLGEKGWILPPIYRWWKAKDAMHGLRKRLAAALSYFVLLPLEFSLRSLRDATFLRETALVADRYPDFTFVGPLSRLLAPVFGRILPVPDLVVETRAPVEVVLARRPELDRAEAMEKVATSTALATHFVERGGLRVEIDTSREAPDEAADRVIDAIWESPALRARLLRRPEIPA